jgi:hypothetical protein
MVRSFSNLFSVLRIAKSGTRSASASKGLQDFRPSLESLEIRLVPSSLPLHVVGNQLKDPANNTVVLRGVNIDGLEFRPDGYQWQPDQEAFHLNLLQSVDLAINTWHANFLRVPVNQDYWFGHDEWWTTGESGDGGAAYRGLVDTIINKASAAGVYVLFDLHWSDMGRWASLNDGQHFLPDDNSTIFWQDAAPRYANNPTVLFDPYNEPTIGLDQPSDADFARWRDGGQITETDLNDGHVIGVYHSPGIQGLINTIRATGARNIITPEGLNWGSDLTGVLTTHALSDPAGNLMYQSHLYPDKLANPTIVNSVTTVGNQYPIFIGEWGDGGVLGWFQQDAATANQDMLNWMDQHNYSWTAFGMAPGGNQFNLIDWSDGSPTADFGALVMDNLARHATGHAPTVVTPAHASANPVTGTTTNLSVLGGDVTGEANLTYTWSAITGPAAVSFSVNGSNAAKNTTATFSQAGTYTFEATIRNAGGLSTTSDVTVTVNQTLTSIVISPGSVTVSPGASQQFTAQARDQFGNPLAVQPGMTWSVPSGGGTISTAGLYQAPATPGSATVRAANGSINGTATVTIGASLSATASFTDVDDWGTGFTGNITLTNTGSTAINGWTLEFDFTNTITDIWDAQMVSHVGNHYVVRNADWDATIAPGQSVTFGFNADWASPQTPPANYVLNGVALNNGSGLSATARFADVDDWGTGFTGNITLTNTGNTAINGWTLEFDFTGNITDIWDAQIVSHVGNHYVIRNADWDATIAGGQSVTFGFNADWGDFTAPNHYLLNGVPISGS